MNTITAMKDADIGIACIVTHSDTPGLPESYVVFDNGLTLPIVGWLDDSRRTHRRPQGILLLRIRRRRHRLWPGRIRRLLHAVIREPLRCRRSWNDWSGS